MAMTDDEIRDAIDGLYAHDSGCTSGIWDPILKQKLAEQLRADNADRPTIIPPRWSRIVRDMTLSDEALEQGYGLEDAAEIARWLDDLSYGR